MGTMGDEINCLKARGERIPQHLATTMKALLSGDRFRECLQSRHRRGYDLQRLSTEGTPVLLIELGFGREC
jgi:hypothetical protein